MWKQLSSTQEERGDDMLNQARDLVTGEVRSMIDENDVRVIENKISLGREMKIWLNTKSGIQKIIHARRYNKYAEGVYQHAKRILSSNRAPYDRLQFNPQSRSSSEADNNYLTARLQAQSLYRCRLICKNAFPSSRMQGNWVEEVREEVYWRTEVLPSPNVLRQDEIKCDSMELLTYIRAKIKHAVDSLYEFDSSQAPISIARNTNCAQALLNNAAFIYRDFGHGEHPRYPYRSPLIQKVVNITWFRSKVDIGTVFHEYFNPVPFEAIALVLTVIECCIYEWSFGTYNESNWKEKDYETCYISHLNSLIDLNAYGPRQEGKNLMRQIQDDILRTARIHAGAPPIIEYSEDTYRTARSLYRCWLSCMNAFPSSLMQDKWVTDAWDEICSRADTYPYPLRQYEAIKCDSMKLLNYMKMKAESAVIFSYEFDTSQAPNSIGRNASRAQALLARAAFIYRDFNSGERPRYPYQHPIIQRIINITWFRHEDDIGIVFHEYFVPIPFEAIALVLTVIECCIDEWSSGTYNESSWKEGHYKTKYLSHLKSLNDLNADSPHQEGKNYMRLIQDDLLKGARAHASAPPDSDSLAGSGGSP